ncbi:hypothetical protein AVEN_225794-1 [Araneus ventricosus]|uniref:Uncharacterized protein n=1 Tax=Araneus ventricosus TaxID=182803 RepID=A0A4Y2BAK9_ARAVE|nr:hypothetical protein AVEN_225794-1 [Araneus ventricosus]
MNVMKRIEEKMERFPEGSKNRNFFRQLYKNLKPDFLRESVRKELNESHANLSGSIQQYFKQHIIYTSALKAVDCNQLEQNESAHDNVELFYLNILKKYVHNDKSCENLEIFEGSQALLAKMLENKQKSKSVRLFTKLVEDNINEFCMQFSEYALQKKVNLRNWEKDFDSAIKQLSQRVAILDSADVKFNAIAPELQTILSSYYKELTEGIEILNKLLELFQEKIDSQLNQTKLALDRSLHLKLKSECLELELLASTYSKSAVDALTIIKKELDAKLEASETGINKLNNDLEQFQILGPEYEQLVEKYGLLLEKVEKQKWAIEFLKADIASKQKTN